MNQEDMNLCVLIKSNDYEPEEQFSCYILDSRFPTTTSTTTKTCITNITTKTTSITSAAAYPLCKIPEYLSPMEEGFYMRTHYYDSCVSLGSKLYLMNSVFTNHPDNEFQYSNLLVIDTRVPNCIEQTPSMISKMACYLAVSMNGKIYVFGSSGYYRTSEIEVIETLVEVFDPVTNEWSKLPPLPRKIVHEYPNILSCIGYEKQNKIFVSFGYSDCHLINVLCYYDPTTKLWGYASESPLDKILEDEVIVEDELYVLGDYMSEPPFDNIWENGVNLAGDQLYAFANCKLLIYDQAQSEGIYVPVSGLEKTMDVIRKINKICATRVCFGCHTQDKQNMCYACLFLSSWEWTTLLS